jgi:hypothetical protein
MLVTLSQDIVLPLVLSSYFPLINAYPPSQPSPVPETLLWHDYVLRATLRLLSFVKKAFRAGNWNSLGLTVALHNILYFPKVCDQEGGIRVNPP